MRKFALMILCLCVTVATAYAAGHRDKKEKWYDGPGKPSKKHQHCKKAAEIVGNVAVGIVNNSIEEYKKRKSNNGN